MYMRLFVIAFCILSPLSLSACKTTVDGRNDRVIIDDGYHHGGTFCPPGQAKKGNC
jgi:hypothetical protein